MARVALGLTVLATLYVAAMAVPYVQITYRFDNKGDHVKKSDIQIRKDLGKEVCKVDFSKVYTISVKDVSTTFNTETLAVYACAPTTSTKIEKLVKNCLDKGYQREFYDEVGDHTTPDIEYEGTPVCTLCDTSIVKKECVPLPPPAPKTG